LIRRDRIYPISDGRVFMDEVVGFLRRIAPEMLNILENRYTILKNIYYYQPIGRRALAAHMDIGERMVRRELDFLKEQKLISISPAGMSIEPDGIELVDQLEHFIHEIRGLSRLQKQVRELLGVQEVYIAYGNSDTDDSVKKDMGRIAASVLRQKMKDTSIIAVSGGSTMAEVAEQMPQLHISTDIELVPARGGLGEVAEYQANAIAAKLATKIGARYRLLYVPESLSSQALTRLIDEPPVKEVVAKLKKADILLFGIGRARDMAERRKLSQDLIDSIMSEGAAAETLGFYFDRCGNIIYSSSSVGLSIEDFCNIPVAIAVAGGAKKAGAIVAANLFRRKTILITDEGAASEMVRFYP
jgi:central glycolytic genes regulator